jgi:hypothetical protein
MWPWAHLAVGYLAYAALVRYRGRRRPGEVPALAVALGTQVPDLIDKPLGWYLGVLPGGRSLGHSAVVAGLLVAVAVALARRRGRAAAWLAFGVGYWTHLAADALDPLLVGRYGDLAYLAWPLVALPPQGDPPSALGIVQSMTLTPFFTVQLGLTLLGAAVWASQGYPGVAPIRLWLGRRGLPTGL